MTEELTPAERIADNIINGNISDAKRALRACSKRTLIEVIFDMDYKTDDDVGTILTDIKRLLP